MQDSSNLLLIKDIDVKVLEKGILEKLDGLSSSVLNLPLTSLTRSQLLDLINIEINTKIDQITVSAYSTRQVENFNPNNYGAVQVIDLKDSYRYLYEEIKSLGSDTSLIIRRYVELKAMMYKIIAYKYSSTEQFLRDLIREAELKDNAKAVGRFNED